MSPHDAPWGSCPSFEWDEYNEREVYEHRITPSEIEQCFDNDHFFRHHNKARSEPEKYGDRFVVRGTTDGGRKLIIIVQNVGDGWIRPITAWEE